MKFSPLPLMFGAALAAMQGVAPAQTLTTHPPAGPPEETSRRGSDWGDPFQDLPNDGSILSGFMVYAGPAEHNVVVGIRGIYLGPKGRAVGPLHGTVQGQPITVEAKAGFAVSGLGVTYGDAVQGFQVFFMRIASGAAGLDPADFYVSDWVGGLGGSEVLYSGNDGRLVLGFGARAGKDVNAISLYQAPPASLDPAPVQVLALDDATHYDRAWDNGSNQGTGFGPWVLTGSDAKKAGFGIGTSTSNGSHASAEPSGGIDLAGKSWMMHAAHDQEATALRTFSGGALKPGQQFCVAFDNGNIDRGGSVGFILENSAGVGRVEFYFEGQKRHDYQLRCNGAELDMGFAWMEDGLNLIFTQLANNHFTLDVRAGSGHYTFIPGVMAGSDISQVRFYCRGAGPGARDRVYVNNLVIRQPLAAQPGAGTISGR